MGKTTAEQECAHVVKHGIRLLLLGIPPELIFLWGIFFLLHEAQSLLAIRTHGAPEFFLVPRKKLKTNLAKYRVYKRL